MHAVIVSFKGHVGSPEAEAPRARHLNSNHRERRSKTTEGVVPDDLTMHIDKGVNKV